MLEINGASGEGGGQVLRSCLSLSVLTGKPFTIFNIRAHRRTPGLRPQHLAGVRAAAAISGAGIAGAAIGSRRLTFRPGGIRPGSYRFDIGTAGSVALVFQTVFLPLAMAETPSRIELTGGTHVPWSPCFHYLKEVFLPAVETMGYRCRVALEKWGFYPRGGGIMKALIKPSRPKTAFSPHFTDGFRIRGLSAGAGLPQHVMKRQAKSARDFLVRRGFEIDISVESVKASCPGSLIFLWTGGGGLFGGFTSLGKKGKPAEKVGREAAGRLCSFLRSGDACDCRLSDQLILPAALFPAVSRWTTDRITGHFLTNASTAEKFLGCRITRRRAAEDKYVIEIRGRKHTEQPTLNYH